jgi:alpha-glucosidase
MSLRNPVLASVLVATVLAAGPATAQALPGAALPDPVVVSAPGARAIIDRHPYRLRVEDTDGHAALAEVANSGQAPQVEPPTIDPTPPGVDNPHTTTLYAPLSFTVGTETLQQHPAAEWEGNLLTGLRSGIQYSARDVLSSSPRSDGGAHLVVSTSDPTGRQLLVDVDPLGPDAIRVSVRLSDPSGVSQLGDSFAAGAKEAFFGFGGRHNLLDQRGQVLSSFVNEENLSGDLGAVSGSPAGLTMFPNGANGAYYPQAQFTSSDGYGFLLDRPELARFKLAADRPDAWNVAVSAPELDYVVAPGAPAKAIGTITALTGRQPAPAKWGLGPMLDRLVKNQGETNADYEGNLKADIANIDRHGLPLTAFRIEGSGLPGGNDGLSLHTWTSPAAQAEMVAQLRKRDIHPLSYLRPWLVQDSDPVRKGYAVRKANGDPYVVDVSGGTDVALVDFTNPEAVRWWQGEVRKVLDLGFDGFMQDYGEHVLFDMHFADGSTGVTMHNAYLVDYAKATRGALDAYEQSHPGRTTFFFTRAGYSGRKGSAAYENANFPGDETTDWGHETGLGSLTTDMLSRAVGGAYGFATDIGGYLDYTTPPTTKELFLRWAEWAALSPVFRLHGTGLAGTHTPWSYDRETVDTYNALSRLHLAAAPLILKLWHEADATGMPPTRPLWLQFPDERAGFGQDQEWMLGPDVLVAPVVEEGATSRAVWFPRGTWTSPETGQSFTGPRSARVSALLGRLPYFFRGTTRPFAVDAGDALGLPSAKACLSRRRFALHLPSRVRSATVTVAGKRARTRRSGGRLVATVDLRKAKKGTYRVRVVARTRSGARLASTRTYRTCVPRKRPGRG